MTALVTGYPTSFLAMRVTRKLLHMGQDVWCVVQAKSMAEAEQRRFSLPAELRSKLRFLEGDSAALDLGLSGREFTMLTNEIDTIHHCAAVTYLGVDRRQAERTNVGGAREILELAEATGNRLRRLVLWSTALVSGARRGTILERELTNGPFHNLVDETRMRAEKLVREAMDHVPTTILRPSIIVGDSQTGEVDRLEGPYLLILLMLNAPRDFRVPMPGRGDVPLNMVPIDYVVNAGCALVSSPVSKGKTFHIVDPAPLTARRVFERIAEELGRPAPRGYVPTRFATAVMRTPGLERFANIPRTFLEQLTNDVVWSDEQARPILRKEGLTCPRFEDYAATMVQFTRDHQTPADSIADSMGVEANDLPMS